MQNIIVNMKFNADVEQAKKQMQSLQNSLNQVMNLNTNSMGKNASQILVQDLQKGQQAAAQLQVALRAAFNEKTGKMDLSKFNQSMQQSGMTIQKYRAQLSALGPTGQQAFTKLAQSVASAEIPLIRISDGMRRLATTFANTARYQLSSSIITGLTQGISQAFTYAKDLNESLNNIRIVTGYSTDQMKDFAKQANKAAKELSTTTTAYTDASLIFYQQGLSGDAVKERADVVVKLANVTGQSAQVVSDQMTAIWNNFDDGSKSMEYYADVITKLGAATASSTDEISDGLEKFAAVSETVGLSYEMATAALATVTAETRQSADVVGTAFKTIFSRMEGLKLGETLEDGTTLNQYSQALATVGVNIKDQNDNMREMDDILLDLGAKWQTLGKDQQIALAQSVAGVRQYNQFIALMGNWDKVQENLDVAINSTGELNAQSEIYEESWAAASDRVKASLEGIYDSLINDEFIIKITDFAAKFLSTIENIVDSMGGFKGIALMLGAVLTKVFSTQITTGITNLQYSLMGLTARGREALNALKQDTIQELGGVHENTHGKAIGGIQGNIDKGSMEMADMVARSKTELNPEAQAVLSIFQQQAAALAEAAHHSAELASNQEKIAEKTHVTGKSDEELEKAGVVRQDVLDEKGHKTGNVTIDNIKEKGDKRVLRSIAEDAKQMHPDAKVNVGEFRGKDSDTRVDSLTLSKKTEKDLVADYEDKVKTKTAESVAMKKAQSAGYITGNDALFDKTEAGLSEGDKNQYYNQQQIASASQTASGFAAMGQEGLEKLFGSEGAKAFQDYNDALAEAKTAGDDMLRAQGELTAASDDEAKARANLEKVVKDLNKGRAEGEELSAEELKQNNKYIKAQAKLEKAEAKVGKAKKKVSDASEVQQKAMDKAEDANKRFNTIAEESSKVAEESGEKLEAMGYSSADAAEQGEKLGEAMYTLGDDAAQARISVDNAGESMNNMKTKAFTGVESLTTMASALMSVGMAISSVKGLWDTWNNSDMSFGEKLISTMTTLGMVIPMVTTALTANNIAKMMGITITKGQTAAEIANTIAQNGNAIAKGAVAAVTWLLSGAKTTETAAVWANNAAWYASPLLWIPLIIMAVIAAVVALIAVIVKLTQSNSRAAKDKAMQENIKALGEQADKTRESVENLKNAWSGWNDAYNTLNDLTKGTAEWNEALMEANMKALELLDTYPELAKYMTTDMNGAITFNKEVDGQSASEMIAETVKQQTINSQAMKNLATSLDNERKANNAEYDIKKRLGQTAGDGWADFGNIVGASVVRGLAGTAVGTYQVVKGNKVEDAIYEKLIENDKQNQSLRAGEEFNRIGTYEEFLNTFSSELEGTTDAYKKSMYETAKAAEDQLEQNRLTMIQNNQLLIANNKALASTLLADDKEYNSMSEDRRKATENIAGALMAQQEAKTSDALTAAGKQDAGTADKMTYDEFLKITNISDDDLKKYGITEEGFSKNGLVGNALFNDTATRQGKYIADQYIKMMKDSGQWQSGQAVEFHEEMTDGEIAKISYVTADGETKSEEMNMYQMMTAVAGNALGQSYDQIVEQAKDKAQQLTSAQLIAMQEDGISGMTKKEFNEIFTQTGEGEFGKSFRINIPQEDLETMAMANGFFDANGQANVEAYKEQLLNQAQAWDEVTAAEKRYNKVVEQTNAQLETAAQETGFQTKTLKAFTKQIEENAAAYGIKTKGETKNNAELRKSATSLAIAYAEAQKGLAEVSEAMDDNAETIRAWKNEADNAELPGLHVLEAASNIATGLEKMFGFDVDPTFVIDNLDLIEDALAGIQGAGQEMADKVSEAYLQSLATGTTAQQDLRNLLQADFEMGTINSDHFIEEANKMISSGKTTAEEVNKALSAIGYEAEIETAELKSSTRTAYPSYENVNGVYKPTGVEYLLTETTSTTQFLKPKSSKTIETQGSETDSYGKSSTNTVSLGGSGGENTLNKKTDIDWDKATRDYASSDNDKKDDKKRKKVEDEIDRYYKVNEQLDRQERLLNKIETAKKKASGSTYVKMLQAESQALSGELDLLKQKDQEIDKQLKEDYDAIDELGVGAKIENGIITNYDSIMNTALKEYNDAIDTYNSSGKTQADEDRLTAAEERYEKIKETLEQYQDTYQEHLDSEENMANKEIEIWEKNWEAYREIQEQKIESWERLTEYYDIKSDYLDKKLEDLQDKEFTQAEQAVELTKKMDNALGKAAANQKRYYEAEKAYQDALKNGYVIDEKGNKIELTDEMQRQLEEDMHTAAAAVQASTEEIEEIQESIDGLIISFVDDQSEKFGELSDELDHYGNRLSNFNDILDLTGAAVEDASELRNRIAASQVQNAAAKVATTKAELDLINEQIKTAEELGSDEETMKALLERQRELQEGLEENLKASLEAVAEQYRVAIETAVKDAQKELLKNSPYKSLEQAREAFDQKQDLDNLYIDEYEKLYQISKLTRDINKSMSENTSHLANSKLSKLLDEANKKREKGVKMTQYELENLQRQYDLKLAEIALEEAQGAKDSMRLTRDSSGNWSYVYSANQEKIDESMQQYEDALYAIEQTSNEYLDELQANILDNQQAMYDALAALRVEDFANYEEYEAAVQRIKDYYATKNEFYYNQIDSTIKDLNLTYEESASKYGGYYATLDNTLTTSSNNHSSYESTISGIVNNITGKYEFQAKTFGDLALAEVLGINSIEKGISTFTDNVDQLTQDALGFFSVYQTQQAGVCEAAGIDLDDLAGTMGTDLDTISGKTDILVNTKLPDLAGAAKDAFENMAGYIDTFNQNYPDKVKKITDKNQEIADSYQNIIDKLIELGNTETTAPLVKDSGGKVPSTNPQDKKDKTPGANGNTGKTNTGKTNTGKTNTGKTNTGKTNTGNANENTTTQQSSILRVKAGSAVKATTDGRMARLGTDGNWYVVQKGYSSASAFREGIINKSMVELADVRSLKNPPSIYAEYEIKKTGKWAAEPTFEMNNGTATKRKNWLGIDITETAGYKKSVYGYQWSVNRSEWMYKIDKDKNIWVSGQSIGPRGNAAKLSWFDTGGYTGSWGPEGKMAVLHEKELVLNKNQTEDFLKSIEMMSRIINVIDRNATLATAAMAIGQPATAIKETEKVVQQQVSIDASFPGVRSAVEIEEALNSLINDAIQYTNRDGWEG